MKITCVSFIPAAVLGVLLVCSTGASGAVVSVNFIGGQGGPNGAASVTGTAGVVPAGNWNNQAPASMPTPVSVFDSTGLAAASLTYNSPNNWAANGTSPGGGSDAALMSGYLDNLQNGGSITITGLAAGFTLGGYSVIIYQNSDSAGSWGYTVTDNASHTGTRYGRQLAGNGGNYPLAGGFNGYVEGLSTNPAGDATASNFVRIDGLTGDSFTITAAPGSTGDGRIRPNGFQIVSVPEPGSAGSLLLGMVGIAIRRRRREEI
jgi:hypothetical protein